MDENDWMVSRFEEHRPHLRAVAYRMLGSLNEADEFIHFFFFRNDRLQRLQLFGQSIHLRFQLTVALPVYL